MAVKVNAPNDISGIIDSEEELRAVAQVLGKPVLYDEKADYYYFVLLTSEPANGFRIVAGHIKVGCWIWAQAYESGYDYDFSDFPGRDASAAHESVEGDSTD